MHGCFFPQVIICIPKYYRYEACCIASKNSHLEHLYVFISYRVANVLLAQQQIIDVQNCGMRTVV